MGKNTLFIPIYTDYDNEEGNNQEIECCAEVQGETVNDDVQKVATMKVGLIIITQHEYQLGNDEYQYRQKISLQQI